MRLSLALASVLLIGCGASATRSAAPASPESEPPWRWAGPPVALAGRVTSVAYERVGPPVTAPKAVRITSRCIDCSSPAELEFDAATPLVRYELDPGIAETVVATVTFPAEGTWRFEPLGGEITVRSPTSNEPPLVIVLPSSVALTTDCGPRQIEDAIVRFAQAFNAGRPEELTHSLNHLVDFSTTGAPLAAFASKKRDEVGEYTTRRHLAGERIHPYLVRAGSIGDNAIDLAVHFVRTAPDLPPGSNGHDYRRGFAGARLFCSDLLLLRFNAHTFSD